MLMLILAGVVILGGINFFLIKFNREVEQQKAMLTLEDTIYLLRGKLEVYRIDKNGEERIDRTRYLIELFPEWLYDPEAEQEKSHNELTHWLLYGVNYFTKRYTNKDGEIRVRKLIGDIHKRTIIQEDECIRVRFSKEDNDVDKTYLEEFIPLAEKIIIGNKWKEKHQQELNSKEGNANE